MSEIEQEQLSTVKMNGSLLSTDEIEELEWYSIVNDPDVRYELRRLAVKARHQVTGGETEEGGFAVK